MKNKSSLLLVIASTLLVAGCSPSDDKDRLIEKDIYSLTESGGVGRVASTNLFFKANENIPYISFNDGLMFLNTIRQAKLGSTAIIKINTNGDVITYTNEHKDTCTIDYKTQTISYSDFDAFNYHGGVNDHVMALLPSGNIPFIQPVSSKYTKGNSYTIDLKNYSKLEIYKYEEKYYLPLVTYSDIFLNLLADISLVYNQTDLFLLSPVAELTTTNDDGDDVLTELGKKYYGGKKTNKVSKSFAEYNYQNILLNFDYFYGIKELRDYTSFDSYLSSKGYKEDLLSGDVHAMDNAFTYAMTTLKDAHTAYTNNSPLYKFDTATIDLNKYDEEFAAWIKGERELKKSRSSSKADLGFNVDEQNGIAYIAFNTFDPINEKQLKQDSWTRQEVLSNSTTLFAASYNQIVSDKYKDVVKYVVVDLATNEGGSSDGLMFDLGVLLGDIKTDILGPKTNSHNQTTYRVDINLDGKFDENDKSLSELGYKIVFIDSKYSFSCGNAMPVWAKANNPNVTIMGETSGGGTCVVRSTFTATGTKYALSGLEMLAIEENGKLVNIESGVKADISLTQKEMLDRTVIANKLKAQ